MEMSRPSGPISGQPGKVSSPIATMLALLARKYRMTLIFAVSAALFILAAVIAVSLLVGNLAEDNLIRLAEENTIREARHLKSMAERMLVMPDGQQSMAGMASADASSGPGALAGQPQPVPNTMDFLASPAGLPSFYEMLVEGLVVPRLSLLALDGSVLWSSDPDVVGRVFPIAGLLDKAAVDGVASKFRRDKELTDSDGVRRRIDVMEMYLPIPDANKGRIIGAILADRDVTADVTIQVEDAKRVVLWTTITTMGLLFLLLLGFILAADVIIHRSRERELSIVEGANRELETRVEQRTRELGEAQKQLVRGEKLAAIGQLAGSVAHDLRSPLGAITNAVYYLKRSLGADQMGQSNPRISQFLQVIDDQVHHSNKIIADLMAFGKTDAPAEAAIDLMEVLDSALSTIDIRDDVLVNRQPNPQLPDILADGDQLRRVFANLAGNAQDAMPEGGELTITAGVADGYALVTFKDTGTGIPDENLDKIFDPLFTTKIHGTGLGLAACQQIVSRHNGTIEVTSEPGKGATFTVRLPLNNGTGPLHGPSTLDIAATPDPA